VLATASVRRLASDPAWPSRSSLPLDRRPGGAADPVAQSPAHFFVRSACPVRPDWVPTIPGYTNRRAPPCRSRGSQRSFGFGVTPGARSDCNCCADAGTPRAAAPNAVASAALRIRRRDDINISLPAAGLHAALETPKPVLLDHKNGRRVRAKRVSVTGHGRLDENHRDRVAQEM